MDKLSILIIQEEAIIAADLAHRVEQLGLTVVGTALSMPEAIERAKALCPHVALTSVNLGGRSIGIQTAKAIQEHCGLLPVLFLFCYPEFVSEIKQAELPGPYTCIPMPFTEADIRSALRKLLPAADLRQSTA